MAYRGHIGGGRQGFQIDPSMFLRGGDEDKGNMEMAMTLMGYGKGTSPQDRALSERGQLAEEMWRQGQLDIAKRGETRQEQAAAAELARQEADRQQHLAERAEDIGFRTRQEKAGIEEKAAAEALNKQKLAGEMLKELLPFYARDPTTQKVLDPEYTALKERTTPGLGAQLEQAKADLRNRQITEGVAKYQKAGPKERETLAKGPGSAALGPPDVVDEILKQSGVQVAQPGTSVVAGPSGGLKDVATDVLWNLPGGVENLFRMGANLGSSAWYGKGAPQYKLMPWTHAADEWAKGGPEVAPAVAGPVPRPQFGNYGVQAEPVETPPEWQYGVGPQRPPASLNDLLAKALQGQ